MLYFSDFPLRLFSPTVAISDAIFRQTIKKSQSLSAPSSAKSTPTKHVRVHDRRWEQFHIVMIVCRIRCIMWWEYSRILSGLYADISCDENICSRILSGLNIVWAMCGLLCDNSGNMWNMDICLVFCIKVNTFFFSQKKTQIIFYRKMFRYSPGIQLVSLPLVYE